QEYPGGLVLAWLSYCLFLDWSWIDTLMGNKYHRLHIVVTPRNREEPKNALKAGEDLIQNNIL
ncbi:MAG: hypothetical protein QX198_05035, partial [Methylococcaceae bacterium]